MSGLWSVARSRHSLLIISQVFFLFFFGRIHKKRRIKKKSLDPFNQRLASEDTTWNSAAAAFFFSSPLIRIIKCSCWSSFSQADCVVVMVFFYYSTYKIGNFLSANCSQILLLLFSPIKPHKYTQLLLSHWRTSKNLYLNSPSFTWNSCTHVGRTGPISILKGKGRGGTKAGSCRPLEDKKQQQHSRINVCLQVVNQPALCA